MSADQENKEKELLYRLSETVLQLKPVVDDHEKRLRWLERGYLIAVGVILTVDKILTALKK